MPSISFTPSQMQSTREYWTPERIANASPALLPYIAMPEGIQQKYDAISQAETEMAFCGAPEGSPYTHVENTDAIFKKAGRLYYTNQDGKDKYATAQLVGNPNIIMTAAQCLKQSGGEFFENHMFARAYKNKKQIAKLYVSIKTITIQPDWDEDIPYPNRIKWDYGFAKTARGGHNGCFQLSRSSLPRRFIAIGYPKNYGNKKEYMCYIKGTKGNIYDHNRVVTMQGNCMNNGSVGGGWFIGGYDGCIRGLNTGIDYKGNIYGPVFDAQVLSLLEDVRKKPVL